MGKIIEVFRAGKQTSSSGSVKTWTKSDLDTIVKKYNEGSHEAPLVIGHPKTDDPAFGWVKSLKRKGNVLFAELDQVIEEFQEMFNKGMYKKRSIALYNDMTLKHVGFLGAMPPAVKGLADFKFSEDEEALCFEISPSEGSDEFASFETSWGFQDVGRMARNLREYFIGKGETEAADKITPNHLVKGLEDFKPSPKPENQPLEPSFNEQPNGEDTMELKDALLKIKTLETQNAEFSEKNKTLESDLVLANEKVASSEKEFSEFKEKLNRDEVASFCESLIKSGKLASADKELTMTSLLSLQNSEQKFEFGEGENKTEKSAFEAMKDKLSSVKPSVEFQEFANKDDAPEGTVMGQDEFSDFENVDEKGLELDRKVKKVQAEKGIEYSEALEIVENESK